MSFDVLDELILKKADIPAFTLNLFRDSKDTLLRNESPIYWFFNTWKDHIFYVYLTILYAITKPNCNNILIICVAAKDIVIWKDAIHNVVVSDDDRVLLDKINFTFMLTDELINAFHFGPDLFPADPFTADGRNRINRVYRRNRHFEGYHPLCNVTSPLIEDDPLYGITWDLVSIPLLCLESYIFIFVCNALHAEMRFINVFEKLDPVNDKEKYKTLYFLSSKAESREPDDRWGCEFTQTISYIRAMASFIKITPPDTMLRYEHFVQIHRSSTLLVQHLAMLDRKKQRETSSSSSSSSSEPIKRPRLLSQNRMNVFRFRCTTKESLPISVSFDVIHVPIDHIDSNLFPSPSKTLRFDAINQVYTSVVIYKKACTLRTFLYPYRSRPNTFILCHEFFAHNLEKILDVPEHMIIHQLDYPSVALARQHWPIQTLIVFDPLFPHEYILQLDRIVGREVIWAIVPQSCEKVYVNCMIEMQGYPTVYSVQPHDILARFPKVAAFTAPRRPIGSVTHVVDFYIPPLHQFGNYVHDPGVNPDYYNVITEKDRLFEYLYMTAHTDPDVPITIPVPVMMFTLNIAPHWCFYTLWDAVSFIYKYIKKFIKHNFYHGVLKTTRELARREVFRQKLVGTHPKYTAKKELARSTIPAPSGSPDFVSTTNFHILPKLHILFTKARAMYLKKGIEVNSQVNTLVKALKISISQFRFNNQTLPVTIHRGSVHHIEGIIAPIEGIDSMELDIVALLCAATHRVISKRKLINHELTFKVYDDIHRNTTHLIASAVVATESHIFMNNNGKNGILVHNRNGKMGVVTCYGEVDVTALMGGFLKKIVSENPLNAHFAFMPKDMSPFVCELMQLDLHLKTVARPIRESRYDCFIPYVSVLPIPNARFYNATDRSTITITPHPSFTTSDPYDVHPAPVTGLESEDHQD